MEDPIYALVHSLDQYEIKFLRTFVPPGYTRIPKPILALFEAILTQASYEKTSLEAQFTNLRKKRSMLKDYVLKCMRIYGDEKDVRAKISAHLRDYEFLYAKGLYDLSLKSLIKARELAEKYQVTGLLIYILNLEKRRLVESTKKGLLGNVLDKNQEILSWLSMYGAELEAEAEYHELLSYFRLGGKRLADIQAIAKSPDFPLELEEAQTFFTKVYRITSHIIAQRAVSKTDQTIGLHSVLLAHWNDHPEIKEIFLPKFRITLSNYAVICIGARRLDLAPPLIEELESIDLPDFNQKAEQFQSLALLKTLYALNHSEVPNVAKLEGFINQGFDQFRAKINLSRGLAIKCNLLHLMILEEHYDKARFWVRGILEEKKYAFRKEIYNSTRLLRLVLLYELKDFDSLENEINACYQYFHKTDFLSDFSRLIISHFRKLLKSPSSNESLVLSDSLGAQLLKLNEHRNNHALGMGVFYGWSRSKVSKQSIRYERSQYFEVLIARFQP